MLYCKSISITIKSEDSIKSRYLIHPTQFFPLHSNRLNFVILTFSWVHISGCRHDLISIWWIKRLFVIFKGWVLELSWKRTNNLVAADRICCPLLSPLFWWHINVALNFLLCLFYLLICLLSRRVPLFQAQKERKDQAGVASQARDTDLTLNI